MTITLEMRRKFVILCMRIVGGQSVTLLMLSGSMWAILTSNLNMQHASAMFVPCLLTTEQKEHCFNVCQDLCQHPTDSLLSPVMRVGFKDMILRRSSSRHNGGGLQLYNCSSLFCQHPLYCA